MDRQLPAQGGGAGALFQLLIVMQPGFIGIAADLGGAVAHGDRDQIGLDADQNEKEPHDQAGDPQGFAGGGAQGVPSDGSAAGAQKKLERVAISLPVAALNRSKRNGTRPLR